LNIENKILLSEDKQIPNELFGELEHPTNGQNVNQLCKLEGYAFSTNSDEVEVKIFCDKVMVFEAINGMPRFDIYKKYENSEKAYRSGFLAHLYLNDFSEGDHNITAIVHVGRQEKEIGLCKIHLKKTPDLWTSLRFDSDTNKGFTGRLPNVVQIYQDFCKINPKSKILEIGCQYGRVTLPFTQFLSSKGTLDGLDIIPDTIEKCKQNITTRYPNFSFKLADVYNKWYNPNGKIKASEYRFPYADETYDFVYLISVFTHMLPCDMENYLKEISRVLKKGRRCLITFFLLNENSIRVMESNKPNQKNFRFQKEGYRTTNKDNSEAQTAYPESKIRDLYEKYELSVLEPINYGNWALEQKTKKHPQDVVIAIKN